MVSLLTRFFCYREYDCLRCPSLPSLPSQIRTDEDAYEARERSGRAWLSEGASRANPDRAVTRGGSLFNGFN